MVKPKKAEKYIPSEEHSLTVEMMSTKPGIYREPVGFFKVPLYITTSTGETYMIAEGREGSLEIMGDRAVVIFPQAANHFHIKIDR